ncbi:MAG: hypothetical protein AAGD33_18510 [Actinomycetota bacterium]
MDDSTSVAVAVLVIGVFGLAACTLAMSQLLPRAQRRRGFSLPDWLSFGRRPRRREASPRGARAAARVGSGPSARSSDAEMVARAQSSGSALDRPTARPGVGRPAGGVASPAARRATATRAPIAGMPARSRLDTAGDPSMRPSRQPAMRPDVLRRERERIDAAATRRFIDQMADEHPEVLAEVVGELLAQDRAADGRRDAAP